MNIENFDDLLRAARRQPLPQRLLFVFADIELPDDATEIQRLEFEQGEGGALVPRMCVDKALDELESFEQLAREAQAYGQPWGMVFAAALSGSPSRSPSSAEAEQALQDMVEAIRRGQLQAFIPFNPQGQAVVLG
ncbi:ribonucleotide reductase subunit alpha [Hydrogenophaga sp. BPS33]|uniref:ribonucleotide reductase subunit alpha n=1 Tax=Hydrogenophaga sp. BPS33 TaxID=2651974 RepID=UPI00131F4EBB|nr:ribonucleotide reductase subunit alpha [Hydrogenophaga sp. BPS33]QHE86103.1 ribonucleotide reductase subunit alpha [Hydrogenophaga sp. BPS33]